MHIIINAILKVAHFKDITFTKKSDIVKMKAKKSMKHGMMLLQNNDL